MSSVTFLNTVGGDGSTVTDDANVSTGLDGGGHRTRFVPALAQIVAVGAYVVGRAIAAASSAVDAANSAASALGAPGTNATSLTSMTIGAGSQTFVIQTGKLYVPGQTVVAAAVADATKQMAGIITAYNSGTGSITVAFSFTSGAGTYASWQVALAAISAVTGVPTTRQVVGAGLATGGGALSADQTITVTKGTGSDVNTGTDDTKALTTKALMDAMASVSIADAATMTPDFAAGMNFHITLGGNRTLANPSNQIAGESGRFRITQDATGSRTLSFGSNWKFAGGAPTLSTAANAVDVFGYFIHANGSIECSLIKALA